MIAERAGVQRHTLYAHFPGRKAAVRGLFRTGGCNATRMPDPQPWQDIGDPEEKLRTGLAEIYGWYERNADLVACVLRDAEHHALTRDIVETSLGSAMAACRTVLGDGLPPPGRGAAWPRHEFRDLAHADTRRRA